MKTNKLLLLVLAALIFGMMIVFIVIFRKSLDIVHERQNKEDRLKVISVDNFDKIVVSSNWDVFIHQGKRCLVSIDGKNDSILKPVVTNINGTLNLMVDSALAARTDLKIKARISVPFLSMIKAGNGSAIRLSNYTTDSIQIILNDGSSFESNANTLKRAFYKTNGKVEMKWVHPL